MLSTATMEWRLDGRLLGAPFQRLSGLTVAGPPLVCCERLQPRLQLLRRRSMRRGLRAALLRVRSMLVLVG